MTSVDAIGIRDGENAQWLSERLNDIGINIKWWDGTKGEVPRILLACLERGYTSTDPDSDDFAPLLSSAVCALLQNAKNRLLMCLFEGGKVPTLLSGTKPADFRVEEVREESLHELIIAIKHFCK